MKRDIILSAIVAFIVTSCGSSSATSISTSTSENIENIENNKTSPTIFKDSIISIKIIKDTLLNEGYNIVSLVDENNSSTNSRGLDLEKYIYISDSNHTISVLGNFVCVISNVNGEKVLATLDAPKDFDIIEKNSELVLRGNLLEDNSRYILSSIPTGFVNLNTINTDKEATISSLLDELRNSFNQFTIINPHLSLDYLTYKINSKVEESSIFCDDKEFILDTSKGIINFNGIFKDENIDMNCTTQSGILLGTISRTIIENNNSIPIIEPEIETIISGDLYRNIFEDYNQTQGRVSLNKEDITFIPQSISTTYGSFELKADGNWIYRLNIDNNSIKALNDNQVKGDIITIRSIDGVEEHIIINIEGKSGIIVGDLISEVTEYNNIMSNGKVSILYDNNSSFIPQNISTQYGSFELDANGEWRYTLNMNLDIVKRLTSLSRVEDIINIQTTNNIENYITIYIGGISKNLTVDTINFDNLPIHIESKDNRATNFIYPKVTARGDYPIIENLLNNRVVDANREVLLMGGTNLIEININELYGDENLTLSKEIIVSDTTAPTIDRVDYEPITYNDFTNLVVVSSEENTSIFVNGNFITNTEESLEVVVELNTSGDSGIKEFNITAQDLWGNESNITNIQIRKE
ncbi:Probable RTX [hydrothermal vent metagenome]|uniref:Probable RTX n=1 Tax=hydrothermal vent metagenome TaxID=652676 RepID=A0A1W1EHR4_9ZZZZ